MILTVVLMLAMIYFFAFTNTPVYGVFCMVFSGVFGLAAGFACEEENEVSWTAIRKHGY